MKGVIIAGGKGTRLMPITKVTNKHLLPVYNKPMIYYPLETLISGGIKNILVITGPEHSGDFLNLLGSGKEFGAKISYEVQSDPLGIAHAVSLAEDFVDGEKAIYILGDNIFENSIKNATARFSRQKKGARIFLKETVEAERFGVAELKGSKVIGIEEKPKKPKSNYAVTGLYMYDRNVFDVIRTLKPSKRGELEITSVSNAYIKKNEMSFEILKGEWTDAGTFDSLMHAANLAQRK